MKKLLVLTSILALTGSALGQGTVNFINFGISPAFDGRVTTAAGEAAGDTYWGQLFAGADAGSLAAVGTPVQFSNNASTGAGTGIVNGGTVTIPGIAAGGPAAVQLRAWAAASGSSWDEAAANPTGEFGTSNTVTLAATGDPTALPPGTPVALAGLEAFTLTVVPEPSTWALLVLGLGALAIRRRK
jgi:hypothetical protein